MSPIRRLLSRLLLVPSLAAGGGDPAVPAALSPAAAVKAFDYDAGAPLDVRFDSTWKEGALTIRDLTYASPKGGRVPATLIVPDGPGPFAGVLLMHGLPGTRGVTLPEARALARRGAVTLSIDAPFSRGARARGEILRFDERDRDEQIQLIVDWRRGVDLLLARQDVDPKRLAYVGWSYGGAMGGLLAGVEKRLHAFALVVGDGGLVSHFLTGNDPSLDRLTPARRKRWLAAMQPIEPLRFVGHAAPAHLLFQNGRVDDIVPAANGRAYQEAGSQPKTVRWYDAGHGLDDEATRDRREWLAREIGLAPEVTIPRSP
ncbi:MAG TPA: alpha/beta fold hydrolase [Thermoanaerobaculia bacterium]|jgi:dienelactone hydrolase